MTSRAFGVAGLGFLMLLAPLMAQPPGGGFGGGGPGGPGGQERKVLKDYDKNKDGWLNAEERNVAREALKKDAAGGGRRGGFGGPGGGRGEQPSPGKMVKPDEVKTYGKESLYDPTVLRTIFITFENKNWEQELEDFHGTDVDVPAEVIVDGKAYHNVGIHFRGMSSYGMVRAGSKRSMNLAVDMADSKQKIAGYKTLNLLNNHEDATAMSTVLYSHIARQYIPAPKANFVKVVINGENWGVYTNVQQFNKDFTKENYNSDKGARWKVRGSPGGQGGIEYLGDDPARYKRIYTIKSKDEDKSWQAFIKFAKTLNQTPPDQLEAALLPMLDLDGLLYFLALDVTMINGDGFWTRASDFTIYLDEKGKFHFIPHDMNESFHAASGPGGGGGMRFAMPKPGEVMPPGLQDQLRLTDAQKKELAAIQKATDDKLNAFLTDEQRKQLKEMQTNAGPPMGGGFGGPGGGGLGGPGAGGPPGGGGFGVDRRGMGPAGGGGLELDPLVGLMDSRKALRSKILAVPSLRAKYLADVKTIAEKSLDWKTLGPVVAQYRNLIAAELKADTKKLEPFEAFERTTGDTAEDGSRGREMALRAFADQRRKYLLSYQEKK